MNSLLVMIGGALGALARYQFGHMAGRLMGSGWPWGTLGVNIIGGLAMGLLAGWLARHGSGGGEQARLLLGVGVLGGFTTFSAFSLETALMIERGQLGGAAAYAGLSVLLSVGALFGGLFTMRALA
ncbi:fluoride efflux transporter CrcB [Sphingobium sp. DEHP117]|uniref:fluoride efflux transporter CrcB n=1 Tax=Sphingobium sp. DEHP117 TaxID=2993436 RepID=UPI0027D5E7EA|nr:fluoride efflux transporter CrcB [Sphingobium sp. DEHP117]MDQ4421064.1 fluoride efflux transporter CrcB [Sphingobium sp. DEHP117]